MRCPSSCRSNSTLIIHPLALPAIRQNPQILDSRARGRRSRVQGPQIWFTDVDFLAARSPGLFIGLSSSEPSSPMVVSPPRGTHAESARNSRRI